MSEAERLIIRLRVAMLAVQLAELSARLARISDAVAA
jgi:hypothetical protein